MSISEGLTRARAQHDAAAVGHVRAESAPVRRDLKLPPINVDRARLRQMGLSPPQELQARQQNQLRVIKRQLIEQANVPAIAPDPPNTLIAVTSALPGEGKTYITINLALSLASEVDRKVVLIDGDTVKRHVTKAFQAEDTPGLTDLLRTPGMVPADVMRTTTNPGMLFISAGTPCEGVAELLASERARKLMREMASEWPSYIWLFDTPPSLLSADTPVLAQNIGQLLFVVRAGVSLQDLVKDALMRFDGIATPALILNDWEPVRPSDRQYYGSYNEYYAT